MNAVVFTRLSWVLVGGLPDLLITSQTGDFSRRSLTRRAGPISPSSASCTATRATKRLHQRLRLAKDRLTPHPPAMRV
jgi:hypothetical protein